LELPAHEKIRISFDSQRHLSSILFPLFDPILDLLYLWQLSRNLHYPIDNQGRCHQYPIIGNGSDILNLNHFGINSKLFHRILGSLRELVALGSPHSENLDLFHFLCLLFI
jgi:hypothetical protein